MFRLENLENKRDCLEDFFLWLFDDNRIKEKSIFLNSEVDLSLCHDYLDSNIYYPNQLKNFFQTKPMIRLSKISQLGLVINHSENLYHNRLEHSKGVYNRKVEELFYKFQNPDYKKYIEDNNLKLYLIADLIKMAGHDIGHPPFSHVMEKELFGFIGAHEIIGQRIMLENSEIRKCIDSISPDLYEILKELYEKDILNFKAHDESNYDVDRLDYLSRDSLYLGYLTHLPTQKYETFETSENKFIDVYDYSSLSEIEKTLILREKLYQDIYYSLNTNVYESCLQPFINALISSKSLVGKELIDFIDYMKTTPIENIDLDKYINFNEIDLYSNLLEIAEKHENKDIRDLSTMLIPNMKAFLNIIYSHLKLNCKTYSDSEKEFLKKMKKLLNPNNPLSNNIRNKYFASNNTLVLPSSHSELLDDDSLISSDNGKIKGYKISEPIYVKDINGKIYELSNHPQKSIDWKDRVKLVETNLVYIPFLRYKGISEERITSLKKLYPTATRLMQNTLNNKCDVNLSPLSVGHNIEDKFLEL